MTETKEEVKPRGRRRTLKTVIVESENLIDEEKEITIPENTKKKLTKGIIAVDNGGDNTKVLSQKMERPTYFKSKKRYGNKSHYLLDNTFEKYEDDEAMRSYIVEYEDVIYLTNLRTEQSDFMMTGNTKSKASDYFIISTLIAVAKFGYDINYLVTSVPLKYIHSSDVDKIKDMLIGEHIIKIDKKQYEFEIRDVEVTAEAQSALLHLLPEGRTTLLEIGSRTVGYATNILEFDEEDDIIVNHIPQKSDTIEQAGVEISNLRESDYIPFCSNIFSRMSSTSKITEDDNIIAFGGGILIDGIRNGLKKFFNNITFIDDPLYAQVQGMLIIGEDEFSHLLEDDDEWVEN